MSLRFYQLTALAVIIGGPLIADVANNAVPGAQTAAPQTMATAQDEPNRVVDPEPAQRPQEDLPPPLPAPKAASFADGLLARITGSVEPVASAAPMMDPKGLAPEPVASGTTQPPPPPVAAPPAAPAAAIVPPPPPPVPLSRRY